MGSVVSSVFGMDSGTKQAGAGIEAGERYAKDVYFKPWTMTSLLGGATFDTETNKYGVALSPELMGITDVSLQGAQDFYNKVASFDVAQRTQDLFGEQKALLDPVLLQQQIQAQERMFGSGRLGLNLAGQAVGAPTGTGAVNPDAYGLAAGQANMLGQLAVSSREQAWNELSNLGQAGAGLMGTAIGIEKLAQSLISQGVNAESARAASAGMAGQIGTGGYNMATQAAMSQDQAMGSFWGGLFGGIGAAAGGGFFDK